MSHAPAFDSQRSRAPLYDAGMKRPLFFASLVAALTIGAVATPAQTLAVSPLVQGQIFTVEATGGPPFSDVAFLVGTGGVGAGTCFTPTFCIDLLDPWALAFVLPADSTGATSFAAIVEPTTPLIAIDAQAVYVSFTGPTFTLQKTNPVTRVVETIAALSDAFNGTTLDPAWRIHEAAELLPPVVGSGSLFLSPAQTGITATWYHDDEGPALFKTVTGDFTVSGTFHVSNPLSLSPIPVPPPISYRLGGLIARDPNGVPGARNWLHVAVGAGDASVPLAIEDKTTVNSVSVFTLQPSPSHHMELQMQRAGPVFTLSYRTIGAPTWSVAAVHVRPDLPPTIEVGPMTYSFSSQVLIETQVDDVTFGP
jgi:hypothetical protein